MWKQLTIIFVIIFLSIDTFGQKVADTVFIKYNKDWTSRSKSYITDTVVFQSGMVRHILTGTAILPSTHNQMDAHGYGLYFHKVTKSDCIKNSNENSKSKNYINSIFTTDSTIIINFNIYDNCCFDFLCDISVDTNATLNLIYNGYGTYCSCNCCFGLTYVLNIINRKDIPRIKAAIINGDPKTLKAVNRK